MIKKLNVTYIDEVMIIINDAIRLLGKDSLQWQQGYPNKDTMVNDINNNNLYGFIDDNTNQLLGIVALVIGTDPNYTEIYEGSWNIPANNKDLTIHRIAVKEGYHHLKIGDALMKYALNYAKEHKIESIKIDTHKKNIPMQTLCLRNGFTYKGIIYIKRDEEDNSRLAYEFNPNL